MNNVFGEDIGASEKYYKSEANFEVANLILTYVPKLY